MHKLAHRVGRASSAAFGVALAACAPAAWGQGFMSSDFIAPGTETVIIGLGGIVNQFDTTLRLDGQATHGSELHLEGNGLKKNLSSFEGALQWRFLPSHRFDIQYYTVKRSGSHDYDTQITIGDTTFPVGATVSASAKSNFADFDYRYSFVKSPEVEVAALIGLYGGKFTYDLNAVGSAGGPARTYNNSVSTTLPLPMLGATVDWYPDRRWKLSARLQGMQAKIGDVDGHAYLAAGAAEYMFVRNFGVGLRYVYADVSADVTKSSFNGSLGWTTSSVSFYGKLLF